MARSVRNLQDVEFDEHTRALIFRELSARFGFPVREWQRRFSEELDKVPRNQTPDEFFLRFGNTFINPILNDILCRNRLHPTFNKFVQYVIARGRV